MGKEMNGGAGGRHGWAGGRGVGGGGMEGRGGGTEGGMEERRQEKKED